MVLFDCFSAPWVDPFRSTWAAAGTADYFAKASWARKTLHVRSRWLKNAAVWPKKTQRRIASSGFKSQGILLLKIDEFFEVFLRPVYDTAIVIQSWIKSIFPLVWLKEESESWLAIFYPRWLKMNLVKIVWIVSVIRSFNKVYKQAAVVFTHWTLECHIHFNS